MESRSFKLVRRLGAIFDHIMYALYFMACILVVFILLSILIDIVMRYFFGRPQIWVIESVSYSLVFITFLSAAWVLKLNRHVSMDFVIERLSPRNQAIFDLIGCLIGGIVWLIVTYYCGQLTWKMYLERVHIESELHLLEAPLLAIIPVGSFILFIQLLRRACGYYLARWRPYETKIRVDEL